MWQVIYEELKDRNFEIIAVALDTGGKPAVEASVRPANLAERPEVVRKMRGWSESEWARMVPPEYPCLIDEEHVVAELYGMVNVPNTVWIDEEGRIVRPAEVPGATDAWIKMDRETFEISEEGARREQVNRRVYVDALRDWVRKGEESEYVLSADEVHRKVNPPSEEDVLAATHARLGRHLYREGCIEAAKHHFQEASRLCPQKWNYRRQSMVLESELVGQINVSPEFWKAIDDLGESPYYEPADMPGLLR